MTKAFGTKAIGTKAFGTKAFGALALACILLLPGIAAAQGAHGAAAPDPAASRPRSEAAQARYPQPVRVGDLTGRQVLEDTQQQRVLGRIAGAARGADGAVSIVMDHGGVLGFGARRIAVPAAATALLGSYLVIKDLDAKALAALPDAAATALLTADTTIRLGLARN